MPFYRSDTFTANGYNSPTDGELIKKELRREDERSRLAVLRSDPAARSQGRADHPVLAGGMIAVGRNNVNGIPPRSIRRVIMRFWKLSKS